VFEEECTFIIAYQNVRGLNSKVIEFYNNVSVTENEYDAVALTETWITDGVYDSELFPERFSIFRCRNRSDNLRGGGVLLAVKSKYSCSLINVDFKIPQIDLVAVKIQVDEISFIYVLLVYVAPSSTISDREDLFSYMESLQYLYQKKFIILGDFNITHLNQYYVNNFKDQQIELLLNFQGFYECTQQNRVLNANGRILDLVLTNLGSSVFSDGCGFVGSDAHHPPLTIEISLKNPKQKSLPSNNTTSNFNFKKADFLAMYQLFQNVSWSDLESFNDVNLAVEYFYKKINSIFEICVPKVRPHKKYPVWFNKTIIKDIQTKDKLRIKSKNYFNLDNHNRFIQLRTKIKRDVKAAYQQYLNKIQMDINENSRSFWQHIRNNKSAPNIPCKMFLDGDEYTDGTDMANAFASYFHSVYIEKELPYSEHTQHYINESFSINGITHDDVCEAVGRLKINKSVGPDNLPSYVVVEQWGYWTILMKW